MSATASAEKLAERLREIRETIRQSVEQPAAPQPPAGLPPAALEDYRRAAALAAHHGNSVGQLNPRPPGAINELIQRGKSSLARAFGWMLRPQREYNQAVLAALDGLAAALEQSQKSLDQAFRNDSRGFHEAMRQFQDFSETVSRQLEQSRVESRESIRELRWSYEGALSRHVASVEEIRRKLNEEIRELNRRLAAQAKAVATQSPSSGSSQVVPPLSQTPLQSAAAAPRRASELEVDYYALEKDFRGTEQEIRERQSCYVQHFRDCTSVLDIACGRGEFLELMKSAGVPASGVDLDADMVGRCLEKGLTAVQADVFVHLAQIQDNSLGGIFCSQFVEHLEPADYTRLVLESARKLGPGGVLAIETQNPECLAIFSQSFYIDPTHVRPIPAAQMRYLFAQAGLENVAAHYLSPAARHLPVLPELHAAGVEPQALDRFNQAVKRFNATFFGGMDYCVIGRKPPIG